MIEAFLAIAALYITSTTAITAWLCLTGNNDPFYAVWWRMLWVAPAILGLTMLWGALSAAFGYEEARRLTRDLF